MEESHQKVIDELQRKHQRELENLQEEKERLLAEETAATIAGKYVFQRNVLLFLTKTDENVRYICAETRKIIHKNGQTYITPKTTPAVIDKKAKEIIYTS